MVDKDFCLSSYLALRYIEDDDFDFFEGMKHRKYKLHDSNELKLISNEYDLIEGIVL